MEELVCYQQCSQFITYLSFSQDLTNKCKKKIVKKNKKKKKRPTLDIISLHFGSRNHELSFKLFFFWSRPIDFPFKMMSYKLNHKLICLGPGSLSKRAWDQFKAIDE
jgi:hypothetical protein